MKFKLENSLSIIVIGSAHNDFTLYPALTQLFIKLHQNKIPCAFLEEGPTNQTLQHALQLTEQGISEAKTIRSLIPEIKKYDIKDNYGTHLPTTAYKQIVELVKTKAMPILTLMGIQSNPGIAEQIAHGIFRENAYVEEIKLYEQLKALGIHFAGIDLPNTEYIQRIVAASASQEAYYQNEPVRINAMVENTFNAITNKFSSGGVLLISIGHNHAHRLGANLLHYYQTHELNLKINIDVFSYYSDYTKALKENNARVSQLTSSVDSSAIKEIYELLPCQSIDCINKGGSFSIPALEQLVAKLIQQHSVPKANDLSFSSALFAPLTSHDQLMSEAREYQKNSRITIDFVKILETKDYSLALRNFCKIGNACFVKKLVRYSSELPINFNQTSSNGNTALAWFELSKAKDEEKKEIRILLEEKMKKIEFKPNVI